MTLNFWISCLSKSRDYRWALSHLACSTGFSDWAHEVLGLRTTNLGWLLQESCNHKFLRITRNWPACVRMKKSTELLFAFNSKAITRRNLQHTQGAAALFAMRPGLGGNLNHTPVPPYISVNTASKTCRILSPRPLNFCTNGQFSFEICRCTLGQHSAECFLCISGFSRSR